MSRTKFRVKFNHYTAAFEEIRCGNSGLFHPYSSAWGACEPPITEKEDQPEDDMHPSEDSGTITIWTRGRAGRDGFSPLSDRTCRYVYHNGNWYHLCSE